MSTIYEEALLDAKKIRESAEHAARDKIMESITPQIREMINQRILFEQEMTFEDEEIEDDDNLGLDALVDALPVVDLADEDAAMEQAASNATASVAVYATGDVVNIDVSAEEENDDEDLMMDQTVTEAFAKLIKHDFIVDKNHQKRVNELCKRVEKLASVLNVVRESKLSEEQQHRMELSFVACIKEAVELSAAIRQSGRGSQRLQKRLNSTIKEMREMSSKYKKNIFDFLFEAEDAESKKEGIYNEQDEVEAEETVEDVEVEESPIEDVIPVADAEAALEDLGLALGLDVTVEAEEEGEAVEVEEEFGEEEELDLEEVYEIDESVLRRELSKMRKARRLREQEEAVETWSDPEPAADLGDVILDVDEDDLLNALADELGSVSETEVTVETRRRNRRSRPSRRRASNSRSAHKAIREAAEYKRAAAQLKKQLVEMNLFNAKLLYANKLLQNKKLTVKQQRAIVEALDNAKTLREAKLLYKSLSGSLARRGHGGKNLSESVRRTLGSSSRSTRSGSSTKSGVETDRWAVLAGISKN